jgi:putative DNA methylase
MLKRLIEVALPLKEVSEQSAREKSIRHGHISTLHIWWARRPLAACRAVVFASLIPDPDDPECPESFRELIRELLGPGEYKEQFAPKNVYGAGIEDTPRNRCLEFIKYLVRWENSNKPEYIEPARKLIALAHKFLHPHADGDAPKVLDPFAGGGAIPLEALRLGCEAHAVDLNPVAHLIELCTLVYPQKYGQPESRPVPEYIKRLSAHRKAMKRTMGQESASMFDDDEYVEANDDLIPNVEITEAEYRKNPLAADVKFWGHWVLDQARREISQFYPADGDGGVPVAYLWARTITCPNPACGATIPLVRQLWLCKKANKSIAMRLVPDAKSKRCRFEITEGKQIDFDPNQGTMRQGRAACPSCQMIVDGKALRTESKAKRMGQQLMVVVTAKPNQKGKKYRPATIIDEAVFQRASDTLAAAKVKYGPQIVPDEPITPDRPSPNSRGLSGVSRYGLDTFGSLFNERQLLTLTTFVRHVNAAFARLHSKVDVEYARAVGCYMALCVDELARFTTALNSWKVDAEAIVHVWGRQALPMVWDYCENNAAGHHGGTWEYRLDQFMEPVRGICLVPCPAVVKQGATNVGAVHANSWAAIVTDPPYYDAVPYSDLSDFFYVWLKRSIGDALPNQFRSPLTPKSQEVIAYYGAGTRKINKPPTWYEQEMQKVFLAMHQALNGKGICCIMFAHKSTSAWEVMIGGLIRSGLVVTSSWPIHTEMSSGMVKKDKAMLASSILLACRPRSHDAVDALWDDVRTELRRVAKERLDFFWSQGIRGADFFISAIGPALSVFGQYEHVTKLDGEPVTVGQFLDEVRALVTTYALTKILKTTHTGTIDAESRFYVVWKWSYVDAKVPADESFKLAQALGMNTEIMWDRTGALEKSGEDVQAVPVAKRMKIKDLGEPNTDGSSASLIDVLHRMCLFREKNDTVGMAEFLNRSGQSSNSSLWLVAQAVSEILPDDEKEKQLMQGLLNQKDGLEEATRQKQLF